MPGPLRGALWRDAAGEVQGAVAYKVDDHWDRNRPAGKAEVTLLVGATPEAERELWRHLCEIDWVATVTAGNRGVDDPLQLMLADGRSLARVDVFDCIWARLLDVPAALGARRSLHADRVVVEVDDPQGFAAGRWSIELAPDGAEVKPSDETADVALSVRALSAAYLGGRSVRRLHEAGLGRRGDARRRRSSRRAAVHPHRPMVHHHVLTWKALPGAERGDRAGRRATSPASVACSSAPVGGRTWRPGTTRPSGSR